MSDSETDSDCPMDIEAAAEAAMNCLIPEKSKSLYEGTFRKLEDWKTKNRIGSIDEKALLAYFGQELKDKKPSTTWSHYSMLRTMLNLRMGINITGFLNLKAFLKRKSDGYRPKKSKILSKEQIFKFLKDAEDSTHLVTKVALIVGVYGACRREEIMKLSLEDIEDLKDSIKITIPNTKTKIMRQFIVTEGTAPGVDMLQLFRTYAGKRAVGTSHSRFFVSYRNGKCTKQPVGINMIAKMPKIIAEYLKLSTPELYTGHCFRRSSASLLADSGVDMQVLKRHGGWKSSTVAEGYVENSLQQKKTTASKIFGQAAEIPSTSGVQNVPSVYDVIDHQAEPTIENPPLPDTITTENCFNFPSTSSTRFPVQFNQLTNCTINFYQNK